MAYRGHHSTREKPKGEPAPLLVGGGSPLARIWLVHLRGAKSAAPGIKMHPPSLGSRLPSLDVPSLALALSLPLKVHVDGSSSSTDWSTMHDAGPLGCVSTSI